MGRKNLPHPCHDLGLRDFPLIEREQVRQYVGMIRLVLAAQDAHMGDALLPGQRLCDRFRQLRHLNGRPFSTRVGSTHCKTEFS